MSKVHPTLPAVTPQGDPLDTLAASLRGAAGLLADRTYRMRKYQRRYAFYGAPKQKKLWKDGKEPELHSVVTL